LFTVRDGCCPGSIGTERIAGAAMFTKLSPPKGEIPVPLAFKQLTAHGLRGDDGEHQRMAR